MEAPLSGVYTPSLSQVGPSTDRSSPFYSRLPRSSLLARYEALLFVDRIRWRLYLPKNRSFDQDVYFFPSLGGALTYVDKRMRDDFRFVATYVDRTTGRGDVRFLGRTGLSGRADDAACERRRVELKAELPKEVSVDGAICGLEAVAFVRFYDRHLRVGQPQQVTATLTREGALVVELNDILQADPSRSPESFVRDILGRLFDLKILRPPRGTRLDDRARVVGELVDEYLRVGRFSEAELALDVASTCFASTFSQMKSRYAASVEGGTTWRIVEPGSIYEARRGSTPKGIIYTRSLKDMADRGQKLTDAESWEFLATAATATRGPDQGRSVQAYRFERVVPRSLLARLPPSLFSRTMSDILAAFVDVSGCALMKLLRPLLPRDKTVLWNAIHGSCDPSFVPIRDLSERRFRAELLPLLLEHRAIDVVATCEGWDKAKCSIR